MRPCKTSGELVCTPTHTLLDRSSNDKNRAERKNAGERAGEPDHSRIIIIVRRIGSVVYEICIPRRATGASNDRVRIEWSIEYTFSMVLGITDAPVFDIADRRAMQALVPFGKLFLRFLGCSGVDNLETRCYKFREQVLEEIFFYKSLLLCCN